VLVGSGSNYAVKSAIPQLAALPTTLLIERFLPDRYRRLLITFFFGSLFVLGLCVLRDYSLPRDEEIQRVTGSVSLLYVFQKLPAQVQQKLLSPQAAALIREKGAGHQLHTYPDRDYGVAFELPATALEQALHLTSLREVFLLRHLLNFLVCLAGIGAFYTLAARRFGSWRLGLLGALLLVVSPRLFSDYFYNSKDAVFLAAFTGAVATAVPFIRRPTWRGAVAHALMCALAIDVRLMGTLVPAATLAIVGLQAVHGAYRGRAVLAMVGMYCTLLVGLVVAMWPFLWEAPLTNFVAAWHAMSHFRIHGQIMYRGALVYINQLPWHYTLVWIGITVPLFQLALWAGGVASTLWQLAKRGWRLYATEAEWQDLLFLGLNLAPLVAVIALHSVLYNGWRQLYFLYPMLLLVALRGLVAAWEWLPPGRLARRYWQPALLVVVAGSLAVTAGRMVRLHPLENLYFNALAPSPIERYYETDYWGLSQRMGLEWVAQHDARPLVRVTSNSPWSLVLAHKILPDAMRCRLVTVLRAEEADYILDRSFDWHPTTATAPPQVLWADNVRLLNIYKLH
jgi:hypothetical protein